MSYHKVVTSMFDFPALVCHYVFKSIATWWC